MTTPHVRNTGTRRGTKACARCRKRKIKCDFRYPSCGPCSASRSECVGFDTTRGAEGPRVTVSHIEDQIAQLETDLARVRAELYTDVLSQDLESVSNLTSNLSNVIADPSSREELSCLPLTSPIFISQASLPPLRSRHQDEIGPQWTNRASTRSINISAIPRHVVDIMLRNYCEIYLKQYPALTEKELYESVDKLYNNSQPTPFDFFTVAITLAISANTLIRYDRRRAITSAEEFWDTAAQNLRYVGIDDPLEKLQALLLLAHYGLLNPRIVNSPICASAATRLCLQLGLHLELPASKQARMSPSLVDARRRLFWTSYSNDTALSSALCRPSKWPSSAITARFPDFGETISPAEHVWNIRKLEVEITIKMYFPTIISDSTDEPFPQWFSDIHSRLDDWNRKLQIGLAETIEFHMVMYHMQIFRLNRPSPRCPSPTIAMRKKAVNSAIKMTKAYLHIERSGRNFYIWYAAHYLTEIGIGLLEAILNALENTGVGDGHTLLDEIDIRLLTRAIRTLPPILRQIATLWPDILQQASALDECTTPVLEALRLWSNGRGYDPTQTQHISQKLAQFLNPSILPLNTSPLDDRLYASASSNIDMLLSASQQLRGTPEATHVSLPGPSYMNQVFDIVRTQTPAQPNSVSELNPFIYGGDAVSPNRLEAQFGLLNATYDGVAIPESSNILWDFEGLDLDQIFAAFGEGRDNAVEFGLGQR